MRVAPAIGVALVAGVAAMSWTALTLAEFGLFVAGVPLVVLPVAAAGTYVLLTRGRPAHGEPAFAPQELAAVLIAVATLFLTTPPDEVLVGGQDPGVYVHVASSVARTGALIMDQPDLPGIGEAERQLVFRNHSWGTEPFPGMYLRPDGRLSPQFYHLFPSLMAVAWDLGGIRAALLVNPLLNLAAVLALYAVAALLLGRRWALAATLIHALAAAQIRQAKFPTAEMMTQFFLLSGVALLALATREDAPPRALAPLAGVAFGMALLTRYDAILFVVPLAALLLWGMASARQSRPVLVVLGVTFALGAQSWLHQQHVAPFYQPLGGLVGGFFAAVAILVPGVLLLRRTGVWLLLARRLQARETALRASAGGAVVCWVLFGWFIRPRLAGQGAIGQFFRRLAGDPPWSGAAQLLAGAESVNTLYLVDLLGAAGLLAALAGIAVLVVSRRQLWENAWLSASVAVTALLTLNVFHDHFLMWVSRRFVPVVVPLTSIAIAAAAAWVAGRWRERSLAFGWAGVALVAAVLALNAGATRAMASGREWPGLIAWYEQFERAVPADAEIYCDQPGFAAPLRFISGRRAFELAGRSEERSAALLALLRRKAAGGRQILYLSQQPFGNPAQSGLVPLGSYPLRSTMITATRRGVPASTKPRTADFVLYRVQPA